MKILQKLKAKQENMLDAPAVTIVFLGDSVTQGCFEVYKTGENSIETVYDHQHAYSTRLREMLGVLYPRAQINIINSGISGNNAVHGAQRLERDVLSYRPDLVVVSFGLNDSAAGVEGIGTYTQALGNIFNRLQAEGIETIFLTENMMCSEVSCHLQDPLLVQLAAKFSQIQCSGILDAYFEAAKRTAETYGVRICDCYRKWKQLAEAGVDTTELLANHLNHPVREMSNLFAYSLLETMFSE